MRHEESLVRAALGVIGGPWKPLLLSCLFEGARRFGELRELIPDAGERVLSQQLREMERDGLVAKRVHYEGEEHRVAAGVTGQFISLSVRSFVP